MSGLYERALEYRENRSRLRIVDGDEITGEETKAIPESEKENYLAKIEEVMSRNRTAITPRTFDYEPKRRGGLLPLWVNLVAVVLLAGGLFSLNLYFNRQEETIAAETLGILTTESMLIETLKKESEQKLAQKNREISDINSRLEEARLEQERLASETESIVAERENILKAEFDEALAAERRRLLEQGLSDENLDTRLAEFEETRRTEFEESLAAVKAESESRLRDQEASISALIAEYEGSLTRARNEQEQLETELASREAELELQFEERRRELEADSRLARDELERIRLLQEREAFVNDRILSSYDSLNADLSSGRYESAITGLDSLEEYMRGGSVATLPGISKRLGVELFLINSLRELIRERQSDAAVDTGSLLASADLLKRARDLAAEGNRSFDGGDLPAAERSYLASLDVIPEIGNGFLRLRSIIDTRRESEIRAQLQTRFDAQLASAVESRAAALQADTISRFTRQAAEAEESFGESAFQATLDRYRTAMETLGISSDASRRIVDTISGAGYRLNSADYSAEIERLEEQLASAVRSDESTSQLEEEIGRLEALVAEYESRPDRTADMEALAEENVRLENESSSLTARLAGTEDLSLQNTRLTERISAIEERIRRADAEIAEIQEKAAKIEKLEADYLRAVATPSIAGDDLAALLQTKLVVRQIIESNAVKERYPDLGARLDTYLTAFGRERAGYGREEVLTELADMLSALELPGEILAGRDEAELMSSIFRSIRALL